MRTAITSNQNLIFALIKAEMKNYKLIKGLHQAGALTEDFHTDLDFAIMDLLEAGEKEREKLFRVYYNFLEQLSEVSVNDFLEKLDGLALELYLELEVEKRGLGRGA